jgi:hypothetical protein
MIKEFIVAIVIVFAMVMGIAGLAWVLTPSPMVPAPIVQSNYVETPGVIMEVLDPSLDQFAVAWQREVARRFPSAVAILAHGGDLEQGRWIVKSNDKHLETADDVAARYQKLYPGRVIVLLCCNPGHIKLHVAGVYHFSSSVWCVPDRDTGKNELSEQIDLDGKHATSEVESRWAGSPEDSGNIYEATAE